MTMLRISIRPLLVLFIIYSFGILLSALSAAETLEEKAAVEIFPDKIKIVRGIGNYPPLEMVENGRLTGLHIEMIRSVAKQLNLEVEFLSLPWARAINYFSEGRSNAIAYFGFTEQRETFSYYHRDNVLSETRWVLLALEERKDEFHFDRNLDGLGDVVIGVQNEYSHGKHFDSMKHLQRDVVLNEFDLERMLKNRRHDLAMMSYQEFLGFKKRGDFQGVVALSPSIDSDPQYIAFAKANDEDGVNKALSDRFAKGLKRFKASNEYKHLLEHFKFHLYQ